MSYRNAKLILCDKIAAVIFQTPLSQSPDDEQEPLNMHFFFLNVYSLSCHDLDMWETLSEVTVNSLGGGGVGRLRMASS